MALRLGTNLRQALLTTADLKAHMDLGFLYIYSGTQPASADNAATGTLLAVISNNSGATGLTFDEPTAGVLPKAAAETWSGVAIASGTAGWFRFQKLDTNETTTRADAAGAVDTDRFDGAIAASGAELNMSNTTITVSATQTVTTMTITLPAE